MSAFWVDAYRQHFQHYLEKPFDIQVYHDPSGASLKLATHDWARAGFRIYASMGLADRLVLDEQDEFGEVILFSDVADREIPLLFVNALFFILQNKIPLGTRFAIGFGAMGEGIARRHGKTALYFTRPAEGSADFAEVEKGDAIGRVFQAYFITAKEDEFLEKEGPDAFDERFWKQFGVELTDEERVELAVDKTKAQELQARLADLGQRSSDALSVRRRSCV
ncbi:MAG: suppressor of fused domain protein [Planctomycetes bacterium]|jgi:hypothetical protein|nr:suppressor of fused domain protein [Planctomycetota bacterium]